MVNTYEIIEFKCIKDFYTNDSLKVFSKDKTYVAKKYINTNEYILINDFGSTHWINPNIDGMDTYFVKAK
jgi:hypothetical protein